MWDRDHCNGTQKVLGLTPTGKTQNFYSKIACAIQTNIFHIFLPRLTFNTIYKFIEGDVKLRLLEALTTILNLINDYNHLKMA